jgi:hypothetical protein
MTLVAAVALVIVRHLVIVQGGMRVRVFLHIAVPSAFRAKP